MGSHRLHGVVEKVAGARMARAVGRRWRVAGIVGMAAALGVAAGPVGAASAASSSRQRAAAPAAGGTGVVTSTPAGSGSGRGASVVATPAGVGLSVGMELAASSFSGTDRVGVRVTMTNTDSVPLSVLTWDTPLEGVRSDMFSVTARGRRIAYTGMVAKRGRPTGTDYVVLNPGETTSADVDLAQAYALRSADRYTVALDLTIRDVRRGADQVPGAAQVDPATFTPVQATSAPVSFDLTSTRATAAAPSLSLSSIGSFTNCTASEQSAIESAFPAAATLAAESLRVLQGASSPATAARYATWFGAYDASRYSQVVSHYSAISAFFSNQSVADVPWTCNSPLCGSGTYAFVFPADTTHTFNLCSVFFVSAASGTDSQPGTLIHESSHFADLAGTLDYAYGQSGAQQLATTTPVNAVANADSHQYFAENDPFRSMGNMRPTATPQTVSVAAGQSIPITLAGTDPDGDALTYAIVTPPTHGTLSGTAPALTYTSTAAAATSDSFTFRASDALSTSVPVTVTINVSAPLDTEGPAIVATPDRAANGAGWYNAPVIYSFTCNDPSGVSSCPSPRTLSTNGANQSFTVAATDTLNNSRSLVVNGINIDATAPTVMVTGVTNGATYPTGAVPAAACSTTDALSGVAVQAAIALTGGPASFTATCTGATDVAGNAQAAPVVATYTVAPPPDTTPPTVTPTVVGTLGSGGWYVSDVNVSWAITDPESSITTTPCAPTSVTTDTAGAVITCTAKSAGGTSTSSVTVKRDAALPTSTVTGIAAGATYVVGSVPTAGCASSDTGGSLVATGATLSWSPALPTTPGAYMASCSGAIDGAGNRQAAPSTVSINVVAAVTNRADVAASIVCGAPAQKSGSTTCTVTLSNNGPAVATSTRALLTLSDGVKVTIAGSATRVGDGPLLWNAGSIAAGSSATLTIAVRATDGRGRIVVAAASQTPDPNLLNNAATAVVQKGRDD